MNKNVLSKLSKIESNVELSDVKVDLGTIDEIKTLLKNINTTNNEYNKFDATVQKNIVPLNDAYKKILLNKDYPKKQTAIVDKLAAQLTKQAADLGIDVKTIPAFQDLYTCADLLSQIQDSINNSMQAVQSLGK